MSHNRRPGKERRTERPQTAGEQVFREVEDAETRVTDADEDTERRRHRGEAGEAITPNRRAQEESRGE